MTSVQFDTNDLVADGIPLDNSSISDLNAFALTFNGYKHFGAEECARIANERDHSSLDKLRACLFFEARRQRFLAFSPGLKAESEHYWRDLGRQIRTAPYALHIGMELLMHILRQRKVSAVQMHEPQPAIHLASPIAPTLS